jgi:hypothetical protein
MRTKILHHLWRVTAYIAETVKNRRQSQQHKCGLPEALGRIRCRIIFFFFPVPFFALCANFRPVGWMHYQLCAILRPSFQQDNPSIERGITSDSQTYSCMTLWIIR